MLAGPTIVIGALPVSSGTPVCTAAEPSDRTLAHDVYFTLKEGETVTLDVAHKGEGEALTILELTR